jgi:hypothetical protein
MRLSEKALQHRFWNFGEKRHRWKLREILGARMIVLRIGFVRAVRQLDFRDFEIDAAGGWRV